MRRLLRPVNLIAVPKLKRCLTINGLNFINNLKILSYKPSRTLSKVDKPIIVLKMDSNFSMDISLENDVAILRFGSTQSKLNILSMENLRKMVESIEKFVAEQPKIKGIVIMSKNFESFSAGADINLLEKIETIDQGQTLSSEAQNILTRLKNIGIPVIAAISGHCIGGGLELAMSCSKIIALNHKLTKLGFPEVLLGLLPGAGGCVHLFNKIDCKNALEMVIYGRMINAKKAHSIGLLDTVVEPVGVGLKPSKDCSLELLKNVAIQKIDEIIKENTISQVKYINFNKLGYYCGVWVAKKFVDYKINMLYPAPHKIIDVFKEFLKNPFDISKQLAIESQGFGELAVTPSSKNLISIYMKKNKIKNRDYGVPKNNVSSIGIIGSGLMGSGITEVSCRKTDYNVVCVDISEEMLISAYKKLEKCLSQQVQLENMTLYEKDVLMTRTKFTNNFQDLKECDFIIETTTEDIESKKKVIYQLENIVSSHSVIGVNTSAISLNEIVSEAKRPQDIVGMHYFSPVQKMELLEIVRHPQLSNDALTLAIDIGRKQGKLCVIVNDCPGFFTSRVLFAIMCEILLLFKEGVMPHIIDDQTKKFGFFIGNVSLMDNIGLDICYHVAEYLKKHFISRFSHVDISLLKHLVENGNLGKKSKKGIYTYSSMSYAAKYLHEASQMVLPNLSFYPIVSKEFSNLFSHNASLQSPINDEDIKMRLVCKFVNECILCLEENVIESPVDGDIAAVFGIGFPPHLGGPFKFVDEYGAKKIVDTINNLKIKFNRPDFVPCKLLQEHADLNKEFFPKK